MREIKIASFVLVILIGVFACNDEVPQLLLTSEDVLLGAEISAFVQSDTSGVQVLSRQMYGAAYAYSDAKVTEIVSALDSAGDSLFVNANIFDWNLLFYESEQLQAYALAGGHMMVSTGLISKLSTEDEFAALISHLCTHSDQRHLVNRLLFEYDNRSIRKAANGYDQDLVIEIGSKILSNDDQLKFTAGYEALCAQNGISILSVLGYDCQAEALLLQQLQKQMLQGNTPDYFSVHNFEPSLITEIKNSATESGCSTESKENSGAFLDFQNKIAK